ncbi:MAG: hypothetical protein AAFQ89_09155 [Cyanobacteria bacterium J06626_18]
MRIETSDADAGSAATKGLQSWVEKLHRRLTTQFWIVMAVFVLLTVVSIDSFQNTASAADMGTSTLEVKTLSMFPGTPQVEALPQLAAHAEDARSSKDTYLEFNSETAARLRRSDLTSASMTRSRLTSAHLFTQRMQ